MFVRKNKNRSGSISVQVISKEGGKYRVVKSFGSSLDPAKIKELEKEAEFFIGQQEVNKDQIPLFALEEDEDVTVRTFVKTLGNINITNIGPELILGRLFDEMGLNTIPEALFRHMVLARLTYPVSKLKTVQYLEQHHGISMSVDQIYRFLDRFHKKHKSKVEQIVYGYSKAILKQISVVFYDMTTLYFEAEDEDDLRKIGFSKDGKFQCPQIMVGLLVGENGFPIAYDIFEGNQWEGHTLLPVLEATQNKYDLSKPIVIADSGLLSKENIQKLIEQEYEFILGARIKNESEEMQKEILNKAKGLKNGETVVLKKADQKQSGQTRLIVHFSDKRAKKDAHNRKKGLKKLRERVKSGKLTKDSINNRGYNKFLTLESEVRISIDETKVKASEKWDGLKGYLTNSTLPPKQVISHYKQLWQIEQAFRISKTDLRIRPIFHYKKRRIEAHLCIAFAAYAIYKELERRLKEAGSHLSPAKVIELSKTMYKLTFTLPKSQERVSQILRPSPEQEKILKIFGL